MIQGHYAKSGQQHGPASAEERMALLRSGRLDPMRNLVGDSSMNEQPLFARFPDQADPLFSPFRPMTPLDGSPPPVFIGGRKANPVFRHRRTIEPQ